jgi:biotin carboxylase
MAGIEATDRIKDSSAPTVLMLTPDRYLIRACDRLGVNTVIVYGQGVADSGSVRFPDGMRTVFAEDHKDATYVLSALARAGLANLHYDAVLCANEYAVPLAALVASHYGCRGLPVDVAIRFRDKSVQKSTLRAAGVPVADCQVIEDITRPDDLPEITGGPMVLKPVAGVGTKLTTLVRDSAELRAVAGRVASTSSLRTFLLERYIPNEEWIVDGIMHDGELVFYSMGYYPIPCMDTVAQQVSMEYARFDPEADKDIFEEGGALARRALGALGLTDGIFHMELFKPTDGGPLTFGECAARRGAAMYLEEVLWKFGVDLSEETVRAALGWEPRLDIKIRPGAVGVTNVNAPPGVVMSVPPIEEILAQPGVAYARVEMPIGARIADQIADAASRLAQVLVTADERSQLPERFADVRKWFLDRLIVAPPRLSNRDLRLWQRSNWPGSTVGDEDLFDPRPFEAEADA